MEVSTVVVGIVCLLGLAFYQATGVLHDQDFFINGLDSSLVFINAETSSYDGRHQILKQSLHKEEGEEEESIATMSSYIHGRRRLDDEDSGSSKKKKKEPKNKKKKKSRFSPPPTQQSLSLPGGNKSPPPPPGKKPPPPPNYLKSNVQNSPPPSNNGNKMNEIDACWRYDPNWEDNRQHLADCAIGFGSKALGGKEGSIYVVTDTGDDPASPKPGTLRYGATRAKPLWIVFARDMVITLKNVLLVNSYKTIDGRGYKIEIAYGPCLTIKHVTNVIIHGLHIHDCRCGKHGPILNAEGHAGESNGSDGDAIVVFDSKNIWIDHNSFANCKDGLIDVIHASTAITITNNYFTHHDKVMMLGHVDSFSEDKIMKATIAFNHFGPGLVQRMPRCRWGYFHVANNRYTKWEMYAIGGSAKSTIRSEANYFLASDNRSTKQVTKRESKDYSPETWNWRSINDLFLNGAYFEESGNGACPPNYSSEQSFIVQPANLVPTLTKDAGAIDCRIGSSC